MIAAIWLGFILVALMVACGALVWRRRCTADTAPALGSTAVIPLSCANTGCPLRLVCINADRRHTFRLTELGLTTGVELSIVHDTGGGLLLAVRGSRVALGHDMAQLIAVEHLS